MPEIQETFEELKKYLDDLPIGLLLINTDKKAISWNKAALELLNISKEEITNNDLRITNSQLKELINTENIKEEELIGLAKPYTAKKILASDKNIILIISEGFQESIGEMSHELKRPITNIKTLCESLLMGAKDDPDVSQRFLENMNNEIDRLSRLINDLLNISKVRSGNLELSKKILDLKPKVEDAIKLVQPSADKKGTTLINEVGNGYTIFADSQHIDHVIQNLIENAIKYSNDESKVTIKGGPVPGSFQVDDTGIGIALDEIPKIFNRFYRVDRTKAKGSSGLGLSIVKNIVDLHGGKIDVKSELNKGSSFIIYLPTD